jgi:hypothetical protein
LIIILGEEIDGLAFLELNALLLHAMGIKMGQAIKIQAIIEGKKVNNLINKFKCISVILFLYFTWSFTGFFTTELLLVY